MSTREVPILEFVGGLATDATSCAHDLIDAVDAKLKLNAALEPLSDSLKPMLKAALAEVIQEQVQDKLAAVTITCED